MAFTSKLGSPDSQLGNIEQGLGVVRSEAASVTLSLTDVASATIRSTRNVQAASQIVSLSDSVVISGNFTKPITQTLNLTDVAFSPRQIAQTIADTISISDVSERAAVYANAIDTINLTNEARVFRLIGENVSDTLHLTDFVRVSVRFVQASDKLAMSDTAIWIGPHYVSAASAIQTTKLVFDPITTTFSTQALGLGDAASVTTHHNNLPVSSIISLADRAIGVVVKAAGTSVDASDTLSLTDIAQLSIVQDLSHTLVLTDAASAVSGLPLYDTLDLTDAAALAISHVGTTLSDAIGINDAVAFVLERICNRFNFAPNIGSTTDPNAPTPPPSTLPADSGLTGFRLRYPHSGTVTDEVILGRRPEFGNIDRFQFDRVNRETRGGTLIVYADPIWPKINTLVLKFAAMKKADAYALRDFMAAHPGEDIKLIDHENRAWVGVITKQQNPITQDDRNSFSASFEFEGERV